MPLNYTHGLPAAIRTGISGCKGMPISHIRLANLHISHVTFC